MLLISGVDLAVIIDHINNRLSIFIGVSQTAIDRLSHLSSSVQTNRKCDVMVFGRFNTSCIFLRHVWLAFFVYAIWTSEIYSLCSCERENNSPFVA